MTFDPASLAYDATTGLVPAVVQDDTTGAVLMLGFMNRDAVDASIRSGNVTFWSRSRKSLWQKGETSGNTLHLISLHADCDGDAVLVRARPAGPTCHTGQTSCFGEEALFSGTIASLEQTVLSRRALRPEGSYTTSLFAAGKARIAQKVGEEAVETVVAAMSEDNAALRSECADLVYHMTVLLAERGVRWNEVEEELRGRMR